MTEPDRQIGFDQLGIANVLRTYTLRVPPHQRDFSWTDREVKALFRDISKAITAGDPEYFLGSIVGIPKDGANLEIVDGQQRLATTAILLSAIRDYLKERREDAIIVEDIQTQFLSIADRKAREHIPRLRLNVQDGLFFEQRVLNAEATEPRTHSHRLILQAAELAKQHVLDIVSTHDPKNHGDALNTWINYLQHRAIVVLLKVPTEVNAYRMFETLNDRGLKTSQSDLVKNYLFGQAGERLNEALALLKGLDSVSPKDPQFQLAFTTASVSQAFLARYYLRSLETAAEHQPQPFYIVNDDAQEINLEHVLPRKPMDNWPGFSPEEAEAFYRRLGNLALMQAKGNSDLKSQSFDEKRAVYKTTPYAFTQQLADVQKWTPAEINARQAKMAEYAPQAWPLSVS